MFNKPISLQLTKPHHGNWNHQRYVMDLKAWLPVKKTKIWETGRKAPQSTTDKSASLFSFLISTGWFHAAGETPELSPMGMSRLTLSPAPFPLRHQVLMHVWLGSRRWICSLPRWPQAPGNNPAYLLWPSPHTTHCPAKRQRPARAGFKIKGRTIALNNQHF